MFLPADFSFVCPTELEDLQNQYDKLQDLGVNVFSVSTDTHFVHKLGMIIQMQSVKSNIK